MLHLLISSWAAVSNCCLVSRKRANSSHFFPVIVSSGVALRTIASKGSVSDTVPAFMMDEWWLNRLGFYNESNAVLKRRKSDKFTDRVPPQTINAFFLEKFHSIALHLRYFNPCSLSESDALSTSKWSGNLLFGLRIYSLIRIGKIKRARKALKKGMEHNGFINNSIIRFCASHLNLKRLENGSFLPEPEQHQDIFLLFEGMIAQYDDEDYRKAICLYHQCNFYSAHPIQYYRLYECYLAVGLYRRASRYLERARKGARGQIPSIQQNMEGDKAALDSSLNRLKSLSEKTLCKGRIYPCSGCLKVWYCSRRCQKIKWKLGHREQCSRRFVGFKGELKFAKQSPLCRDPTVFTSNWS